jgi:hypothetical protein
MSQQSPSEYACVLREALKCLRRDVQSLIGDIAVRDRLIVVMSEQISNKLEPLKDEHALKKDIDDMRMYKQNLRTKKQLRDAQIAELQAQFTQSNLPNYQLLRCQKSCSIAIV